MDTVKGLIAGNVRRLRAVARPRELVNRRGDVADIHFYGLVGLEEFGGISDRMFVEELKRCEGCRELNLYVNSPGGDFFVGLTIYNQLSRHPARKSVIVDGEAASAASVIAMAGDRIVMAPEATMMVHEVRTLGVAGTAEELRAAAEEVERSSAAIRDIYARRTGLDAARIEELMRAETTMTAQQAVELKFADEIERTPTAREVAASDFRLVATTLTPIQLARLRAQLAGRTK